MSILSRLGKDQKPKVFRPRWRGMAPDLEPADHDESQPHLAINVRWNGFKPNFRKGQTHVLNIGEGSPVLGMETHFIGAHRPLFVAGKGKPGNNATTGYFIGIWDEDIGGAQYANSAYYSTAVYPIVMANFGGDIYFGVDNLLKRLGARANGNHETRIQLPAGFVYISAMTEHEGTLLVACVGDPTDVAATSAVFTYDGLTFTKELSGINIVRGFGLYRDKAVAIFDGTPNSIRVRDSAGIWSAPIAPGAGTVKVPGHNCCMSFQDKLYIPTGGEDIFSLDQSLTLTRIPIGTSGVSAGSNVMGVDKQDGLLYFLWNDAGATAVKVGTFNGSVWTPGAISLASKTYYATGDSTITYPAAAIALTAKAFRVYRTFLVVSGVGAGSPATPPNRSTIYAIPRNSSNLALYANYGISTCGDITDLLAY